MTTSALDRTDPTFVEDLRRSERAVQAVAGFLCSCGYQVLLRPLRVRPDAEQYRDYSDAGDLAIVERVEVSMRAACFTSADDYPYDGILVDAVHKVERMVPRPMYVIVSGDMRALAVVIASTFEYWSKRMIHNSKTNRDREVYFCPKRHARFYLLD